MSRRHVEELCNVYKALFRDAEYAFPELACEFRKDLSRLLRLIEERGLHVLTIDLPNAGKHLDRCLDAGEYTRSGLPLTKRFSNRVVIPKFLRGLYLLIFEETGRLKDDCNVEAVFFLRQFLYAAKKAKLNCGTDKVNEAVRDFVSVDESLPIPERIWSNDCIEANDFYSFSGFSRSELYLSRLDERGPAVSGLPLSAFLRTLDTVSGVLATTLGSYCYREWGFRHGPGAISEFSGPANKYSWRNWSRRLENAYPIADCGYHNFSSWAGNAEGEEHKDFFMEPSARLIAVPKTQKGPRLIAAEPAAHQWCQQNLWHYFCTRVHNSWLGHFVRFRDQSLNQHLCVEGSRTGDLITVDLSAASDRVTPHFVGQLFRCNTPLLLALQACRTRLLRQNLDSKSPDLIELRKFSTMGSACTFPVQSLGFLAIAITAVLVTERTPFSISAIHKLRGKVAVFGDDIIVPKASRDLLYAALDLLHFKVNTDKSFSGNHFRESCGVDAFKGVSVTPTYWQQPCTRAPESIASTIEVRNNFYKKFFLNVSSYLASTLREAWPIVAMDSGVNGLKSFVDPDLSNYRVRWNEGLQRMEAFVPVLQARVRRTPTNDDSAIFQYFTESPSAANPWQHGVSQRPALKIKRRWVPVQDLVDSDPVSTGLGVPG